MLIRCRNVQGALLVVLLGVLFGALNVAAETAAFAAGQHLEAKGVVRRLAPLRPMLQQRHQSNFLTYAVPCTLGFAGGGRHPCRRYKPHLPATRSSRLSTTSCCCSCLGVA